MKNFTEIAPHPNLLKDVLGGVMLHYDIPGKVADPVREWRAMFNAATDTTLSIVGNTKHVEHSIKLRTLPLDDFLHLLLAPDLSGDGQDAGGLVLLLVGLLLRCLNRLPNTHDDLNFPDDPVLNGKMRCNRYASACSKTMAVSQTRNTVCPVEVKLIIYKTRGPPRTIFTVQGNGKLHNHSLTDAAAVRALKITQPVQQRLVHLFNLGHTRPKALAIMQEEFRAEYGHSFDRMATCRAKVPNSNDFYRIHQQQFDGLHKDSANEQSQLEELRGAPFTRVINVGSQAIVTVVTPLMARAHGLREAEELVFLDSCDNVDERGSRVYVLMTDSPAGGLPLGAFIATSTDHDSLVQGFNMLKQMMPEAAFHGRSEAGPAMIMCDECAVQRAALHAVWPQSTIAVSSFHILQSVWRFLATEANNIRYVHWCDLMECVKRIVRAEQLDLVVREFNALHSRYNNIYPALCELIQRFCGILPQLGENTNHISRVAMRALKDAVMFRTVSSNLVQLHDLVGRAASGVYERRLRTLATTRGSRVDLLPANPATGGHQLVEDQTRPHVWQVTAVENGMVYTVNSDLGICSCRPGEMRGFCSHLALVTERTVDSTPELTDQQRVMAFFIATGCENADEWVTESQEVVISTALGVEESISRVEDSTSCERANGDAVSSHQDGSDHESSSSDEEDASIEPAEAVLAVTRTVDEVCRTLKHSIMQEVRRRPGRMPAWRSALLAFARSWHKSGSSERLEMLSAESNQSRFVKPHRSDRNSATPRGARQAVVPHEVRTRTQTKRSVDS